MGRKTMAKKARIKEYRESDEAKAVTAIQKAMVEHAYGDGRYEGFCMEGAPSPGCDILIRYRQFAKIAYDTMKGLIDDQD